MKKIQIIVKDNQAHLYGRVNLVAGTVGQVCKFYFDDNWKDLSKKLTYKVGSTIIGADTLNSNEIIIPPKVFMTAGLPLEIGITGYNKDNSIITPTTWCYIDIIQNGSAVICSSDGNDNENDDNNNNQ